MIKLKIKEIQILNDPVPILLHSREPRFRSAHELEINDRSIYFANRRRQRGLPRRRLLSTPM